MCSSLPLKNHHFLQHPLETEEIMLRRNQEINNNGVSIKYSFFFFG
ncbi:hypothetical protein ACJIZ3_023216 [Penstemon smallii]|uniref:Uncharacterized protein n=1 Tax=Penstemon smallii TaxID=265156 RepID=A0ABD3TNM2_9LAMI